MTPFIVAGCCIIFDIVTGVIKGLYNKNINSTYLRKGLYHKSSEILAIVLAFLIEKGIATFDLGITLPTVSIVVTYICIMELVSIIENLSEVNPRLTKIFSPYLEKLKGQVVDDEDNTK